MDRITKHDPGRGTTAAQRPGLPVPHGEGPQSQTTIRVFEPHRVLARSGRVVPRSRRPAVWPVPRGWSAVVRSSLLQRSRWRRRDCAAARPAPCPQASPPAPGTVLEHPARKVALGRTVACQPRGALRPEAVDRQFQQAVGLGGAVGVVGGAPQAAHEHDDVDGVDAGAYLADAFACVEELADGGGDRGP
jgi:hypothetical protein